jgi:ATP-binding cassette subfamily B protein
VNFSYVEGIPIIKQLNLKIKPKERIAVIGYTGAGKSTLINLLFRFYDVNGGGIFMDGHNIKEVALESLRGNIGVVLQDNFLFGGTVLDNIRFGKPDANMEEAVEAAKQVGAHEFILDLPRGYETNVLEHGALLSTGQKQLIAFARALLVNPPILVLDEATSAVDPYSELIIQRALETLLRGRTSISIAHRLSTIVNSDRIFVLSQGEIIEEGSHHELVDLDGVYHHLYKMQFKRAYSGE